MRTKYILLAVQSGKGIITSTRLFSNIKNIDKPACINCKFYKPDSYNKFDSTLNKCEKFGSKNIHDDKIYYEIATSCRENKEKCGEDAIYFVKENNLIVKKIVHHFYTNSWVYFTTSLLFLYFYALLKLH